MKIHKIITIVLIIIATKTSLAQITEVRMYAFGHSLIDHATGNENTTIMYWINEIAQQANKTYATGGQYGFLTTHNNLPPASNWGYNSVSSVWDDTQETFAEADINTILLTAANFIQYEAPNMPHPLDNNTTVIQATETIFDWVNQQESNVRYYIYANWPEMDLQNAYPPTHPLQSEIDDFHNVTTGTFTDWWKVYQEGMLSSRPQLNTRLIPVGMIISKILRDIVPTQIPFNQLYEDSAPHGRATIYFLAGMITYMAVYEENIPNTYMPNSAVHATITNNLDTIRSFIWSELTSFNLPNGNSRVFYNTTLAEEDLALEANTVLLVPNPTKDKFKIKGVLNYNIKIIDMLGRVYKTNNNLKPSEFIEVNKLSKGVYFVQIQDQNNKQYIKKLIKK